MIYRWLIILFINIKGLSDLNITIEYMYDKRRHGFVNLFIRLSPWSSLRSIVMSLSLIILISATSWAIAVDDVDGWYTYNHDAQRSGLVSVDTTNNWAGYRWSFKTRWGDPTGQPLVDENGTVYFSTSGGALFAVHPNGTERWRRNADDLDTYGLASMPVFGPTGAIHYTTSWGDLEAYDPHGTLLWSYSLGYDDVQLNEQNPCVGTDGTIYTTTMYGELLAIHSNGTLDWSVTNEGLFSDSYISLSPDGTIFVNTGHIHAFAPDGTFLWNHTEEALFYGHVVVDGTDRIYASTSYGRLKCLDMDGEVVWSIKLDGDIVSSPSLDRNGNILVGTTEGILYALDPSGNVVWTYDAYRPISSTPVVSEEGTVYLATQDGHLYAIGPGDNLKWHTRMKRHNVLDPYYHYQKRSGVSLGPGGAVYFGGYAYDVYAFGVYLEPGTESPLSGNGLASTPWPMAGGNAQRNGRSTSDLGGVKAKVLWSTTFDETIGSDYWRFWTKGPSIGPDGTLYIIVEEKLHALGANGKAKWNISVGFQDWYSTTVVTDGTVYVSGEDGMFMAIDKGGTILWELVLGSDYISKPTVSEDGTIYLTDGNQSLIAINPDGTVRWSLVVGSVNGPVTIGPDGTLYLLLRLVMVAVTSEGEIMWMLDMREHNVGGILGIYSSGPSSIVVDDEGTIYFCNGHKLIAVSSEGVERWVFEDGEHYAPNGHNHLTMPPPSVAADGTLVLGGHHGKAYGLDSDGEVLWTVELDGPVEGQPLVGAGGSIFLVTKDTLYAIDAGGKKKWSNSFGATTGVFFGVSAGQDGHMYAIHSELGLIHIGTDEIGDGGSGNGGDDPIWGVGGLDGNIEITLLVLLTIGVVIVVIWVYRRRPEV